MISPSDSIRIKKVSISPTGTLIAFSKSPTKLWEWIPGSVDTSRGQSGKGKNRLFPGQYNAEVIVGMLKTLKRCTRSISFDPNFTPDQQTFSKMYNRSVMKLHRSKPVLSVFDYQEAESAVTLQKRFPRKRV